MAVPARPPALIMRRSARRHGPQRGFGLLELVTTLAFLVILLGLMVSLARFVRATSSERYTRALMRQLRDALATDGPAADVVADNPAATPPPDHAAEADWAAYAARSNASVRRLLKSDGPVADAWGNPVGYLDALRPDIGITPRGRPFCFSAGPDGRYLTRDDNLYSYDELPTPEPTAAVDTANNESSRSLHAPTAPDRANP